MSYNIRERFLNNLFLVVHVERDTSRNFLSLRHTTIIEIIQIMHVRCPGLQERLLDLGYQPQHRSYTPLEVRVIVDALGEP